MYMARPHPTESEFIVDRQCAMMSKYIKTQLEGVRLLPHTPLLIFSSPPKVASAVHFKFFFRRNLGFTLQTSLHVTYTPCISHCGHTKGTLFTRELLHHIRCKPRNGCWVFHPPGTAGHCTKCTLFRRGLCISTLLYMVNFILTFPLQCFTNHRAERGRGAHHPSP